MSELHPLDFQSLSDIDKLTRPEVEELLDSCNCLIEAEFEDYSEDEFKHAVVVRDYVRNILGGRQKVIAQHERANNCIMKLSHMQEKDITPEDYEQAVCETMESIRTGNCEITEIIEYAGIDNIPGFELEWCVVRSFPESIQKESCHVKNWEASIGRLITDSEFQKAQALSAEIIDKYNSGI